MRRIREDIHVHAGAEEAFRFLEATGRYAEWLPRSFRAFREPRPDGVLDCELALPLRSARLRLEAAGREPPRLLRFRATAPGGAFDALVWTLSPEGPDETHLLAEAEYAPPGGPAGAILDLLAQRAHRRQALRDALWRLKQALEGAAPGGGSGASARRALVFDLDGVLVDSEPLHLRAARRLTAPHLLSEAEYARFTGVAIEPFVDWMRERYGLAESAGALRARYSALVAEELRANPPAPLDGARELIAAARAGGWAVGLASQSGARWVEATLEGCGLAGAFGAAVSGDDAERGKPAPDLYLLAAARLGTAPARCVAIEDSPAGVRAAAAAGMLVVQSLQASTAAPRQPQAAIAVRSLRELDLAALKARLERHGGARPDGSAG